MLVASGIPVPGDSGGAYLDQESFAQGKPTVLGVHAIGTIDKAGVKNSASGVRVSARKDFLVDGAKKAQARGGGGAGTPAATDGDEGGGCSASGSASPTSFAAVALVLGVCAARRRRRRAAEGRP